MKDQILDEIIVDDFHRFLTKGEKVIWEGNPQKTGLLNLSRNDSSMYAWIGKMMGGFALWLFFWIFFFEILLESGGGRIVFKIFIVIAHLVTFIPIIWRIIRRKKTKYIISDKRVLFQLWKYGRTKYFSIDFDDMKNVVVVRENQKDGVIYIGVKNPRGIIFDTYNFNGGERRHQPTLEMIENVEEVANYIRMGIRNKL